MLSYTEEQNARADYINDSASLYCAEFSRLTGETWRVVRQTDDTTNDYYSWYHLTRPDGMTVSINGHHHTKKVTCNVRLPTMPDGTKHAKPTIWRDWGFPRDTPEPEAGVSWDRYAADVSACAKRFVKLVVTPFAAAQAHIATRAADRGKAYADRDSAADRIAAALGGSVYTGNDGRPRIRLPSGLPSVTVSEGGTVRLDYNPTMSADVFLKYCAALLESKD
jgi:hypothetical protein